MKSIDFSGKTAVITGAASGMGRCAALELVRRGAAVVLCDVNREVLEAVASEVRESGGRLAMVPQ